jgi:hypothetical protein
MPTAAPARASARAAARPIPTPAPVTSATLPFKSAIEIASIQGSARTSYEKNAPKMGCS